MTHRRHKQGSSLAERIAYYSAPPDANGCIRWFGGKSKGYGTIKHEGRMHLVPRLMLEKKLGRSVRITSGYMTCHNCGHRWCIAEDHLYEGTYGSNMHDRKHHDGFVTAAKGRTNGNTKLTPAKVRAIRKSSKNTTELARQFGVSRATIYYVIRRRMWSYI